MHLGVAVDLARRGKQEARTLELREPEGVVCPVRAHLQRMQRHAHVVDRACQGSEVIDGVDGLVDLEMKGHVLVDEAEVVASEMLHVL